MLRTNNKYKADYLTAINEKRKVAVAEKRLRNKRIVCFCIACFLVVGVLFVAIMNKSEKPTTPSGDVNVLVNTSTDEGTAKPTTDDPSENKDDTDVIINTTPGSEESKQPAITDDTPEKEMVIYADKNSLTNDGVAFMLDIGEILYYNDLRVEDGKLYHVYLDVDLPLAWITPDSHYPEHRSDVDEKLNADYSSLEINGLEKYLEMFAREMNDKFNITNAEDYIVVEDENDSDYYLYRDRVYFDHYLLRLDYIKEYCLNYWSEAEHGEAFAELKANGISEEWVEKYGYNGWKRYDSAWSWDEIQPNEDWLAKHYTTIYDMLDDIGIVCERNEYGYVIFDIAKEDFDKLLTLPCAYEVHLLEKETTPEDIYKAMSDMDQLA